MSARKVLPLIVSVKSVDAPGALREAFTTAEPAENAKIADWAWRFGFETAEPFVIELSRKSNPEALSAEIVTRTQQAHATGVVVAGIDYLRRAQVLDALYGKLSNSNLGLWSASLGSAPVADLLEV